MRADRLVATLLLLQRREQVTAAEVADELEVSERTARRDLEALGVAGIPVYPVRGRGGGWRLAGGGRTDLSGLTAPEARALFLLAGPQADLPAEARAALRKLVRALPETMRTDAEAASQAMVLDPTGWGGDSAPEPPPVLATVQEAVIDGHELVLAYRARDGQETERPVHPLGIVAKGRYWYLLAATEAGQRTFRIDRIAQATVTGRRVERPADFDLATAWRSVREQVDELRTPLVAEATVRRDLLPILEAVAGTRLAVTDDDADGEWVAVTVRGHSLPALAADLAGFGAAVDVARPPELRAQLARLGRELVDTYDHESGA